MNCFLKVLFLLLVSVFQATNGIAEEDADWKEPSTWTVQEWIQHMLHLQHAQEIPGALRSIQEINHLSSEEMTTLLFNIYEENAGKTNRVSKRNAYASIGAIRYFGSTNDLERLDKIHKNAPNRSDLRSSALTSYLHIAGVTEIGKKKVFEVFRQEQLSVSKDKQFVLEYFKYLHLARKLSSEDRETICSWLYEIANNEIFDADLVDLTLLRLDETYAQSDYRKAFVARVMDSWKTLYSISDFYFTPIAKELGVPIPELNDFTTDFVSKFYEAWRTHDFDTVLTFVNTSVETNPCPETFTAKALVYDELLIWNTESTNLLHQALGCLNGSVKGCKVRYTEAEKTSVSNILAILTNIYINQASTESTSWKHEPTMLNPQYIRMIFNSHPDDRPLWSTQFEALARFGTIVETE